MKAIVTAIDEPWRDQVANIWGELKALFGLGGLAGAVRPYVTFHVAEDYAQGIEGVLARIAARGTPFRIETHGMGITEGAPAERAPGEGALTERALAEGRQSVLYLHVTRTEALDDVHHVIHHAAQPVAVNPRAAYEAETWLPHIAVASGRIPPADVPRVMEFLGRRDYAWTITATNLCLTPDTRIPGAEWLRFDLQGKPQGT